MTVRNYSKEGVYCARRYCRIYDNYTHRQTSIIYRDLFITTQKTRDKTPTKYQFCDLTTRPEFPSSIARVSCKVKDDVADVQTDG